MNDILTMTRGNERLVALVVVDPTKQPQNLTGKKLTFTARKSLGNPVVFQKISGSGITVTDLVGGLATVLISPGDTSWLPDNTTLVWDLEMNNDPGSPITLSDGTLTVNPNIT
jgi:hypothetical protein